MTPNQIRHLTSIRDLTREQRFRIYQRADDFRANPTRYASSLAGKKFLLAFWEPSSRTEDSTWHAAKDCGAIVKSIQQFGEFSSEIKGEALRDTIRIFGKRYDCIVMRHGNTLRPDKHGSMKYAPLVAVETVEDFGLDARIVNAGTGSWEHPTQALLDEDTLRQHRKDKLASGKITIALIGDVKNSRTIHSLILLLSEYAGITCFLVCPNGHTLPDDISSQLPASSWTLGVAHDIRHIAEDVDVFYFTRIQKERPGAQEIWRSVSDEEYVARFGITRELVPLIKPDAIVMHPLPRYAEDPVTREPTLCEIPFWFDNDPRAKYFEQADNGYYVRAGLFLEMFT